MAAPWSFRTDVNADGHVDVSDLGLALYNLFFLPGDSLIYLLLSFPELAGALGIGTASMRNAGSALVSSLVWAALFWLVLKIRKKAKGLTSAT